MEMSKWARALQWFTNYSFAAGNQYARWFWNGNTLSDGPEIFSNPGNVDRGQGVLGARIDSFIPRPSDNRLIRPFETNVSLLTEMRPAPRVQPNSSEPDDEDAARLAEIAFRVKWEDLGMAGKMRANAAHLCLSGTTAVETVFDDIDQFREVPKIKKRKVKTLIDDEEQDQEYTDDETEAQYEQDLVCRIWNGFHLNPDPGATDDPDSLSWIARSCFEDITWLKEAFDRDEEGFYPDENPESGDFQFNQLPLYWWERVKDIQDSPEINYGLVGRMFAQSTGFAPNQTLFRVIDCKPNIEFPRGRTLVFIGDSLAYCGPARALYDRYRHRWHPYSFYRFWTLPGRFWGVPLFSQLVPLQRRINAIDALVIINREFMTIGQWLTPHTAKVPKAIFGGIPGSVIPYRVGPQGAKPEKVPHTPMPKELLEERQLMVNAIDILSGAKQTPELESSSAIRAGVMLEFFQKEKNMSKSAMLQGYQDSMQKTAEDMLIEISENFNQDDSALTRRLQAAAAEESQMSIKTFTGADLRENVHVRIDIASQLMRSPEAEKELAVQFAQARGQGLTDEEAAGVWKKIGFDEFDKRQGPQVRRAKKMISRIIQAKSQEEAQAEALPLPVDNASIFATVIGTAVIDDRFRDYEKWQKEILLNLLEQYQQQMQEQQSEAEEAKLLQMTMEAQASQGVYPEDLIEKMESGDEEQEEDSQKKSAGGKAPKKPAPKKRGPPQRRPTRKRLTLAGDIQESPHGGGAAPGSLPFDEGPSIPGAATPARGAVTQ